MPQRNFQFVPAVTEVAPIAGGVECRAGTARVRVQAVAEGTFRVRLAPDGGSFDDEPFSYATLPEALAHPPETQVTHTDAAIRLQTDRATAVVQRDPLRIHFEDEDGHMFAADDFGMGWFGERVSVWKRHVDGTRYYGLGEKTRGMDRTRQVFMNWNTDFFGYQPRQDPIYKTLPVFIGLQPGDDGRRRAFGIFFDNSYRSFFDFAAQARRCFSFSADGGELVYYYFAGPTMADVIRRYTALTGRMELPPLWALGYQQSRWSYYPESEVRTLVRQFRDRHIPLDAVHLDIHYMDGYRVFTWSPEDFPDPQKLTRDLADAGVNTVVIVDPGVKVDPGYRVYDEGLAEDAFVTYPDGTPYTAPVWPGDCHFPDFTKPSVRRWFGAYYQKLLDAGVAGFWNDMNEPAVMDGLTAPDLLVHDLEGRGGSHLEAHNVYGLLMARSTYEAHRRYRPEERPFVVTRAAFSGIQRYAAVWTGDNIAEWEHLQLVLPMLLSLGLSGVPFAGSDVGGFLDAPTPELYARWIQVGAFSPFFRTHSARDEPRQEPWIYGPEVECIAKTYIELRYRLLPVFYTLFDEHRRTGLPVLRPLVLHYPDDEHVLGIDDAFLLGASILVAPVLKPGQTARKVYLPEGHWYDFWTDAGYEGGQSVLVDAPLDTLPIFVKAGTVLPMAPLRQHVGEAPIETMTLHGYPGNGTSRLYHDDGRSQNYTSGHYQRATFTLRRDAGMLSLHQTVEGFYASALRHYQVVLHDVEYPQTLTVDGKNVPVITQPEFTSEHELSARYETTTRRLMVRLPSDVHTVDAGF